MAEQFRTSQGRVRLIQGDIVEQDVDLIVNAANPQLLPGAGVSGAIHKAAGPEMTEECAEWVRSHGELRTGRVMLSGSGRLPVKGIIHTVGPVWENGYSGENTNLEFCYSRSLDLAVEHGYRSIAFPAISTGVYGFPVDRAAYIALNTCIRRQTELDGKVEDIAIVLWSDDALATWSQVFDEVIRTMTGT